MCILTAFSGTHRPVRLEHPTRHVVQKMTNTEWAQAIADKSQDPDVKARLLANTEEAAERGAFGSPTFFVGNEIWFGKEHLRDVEEEIVRLTR